MTDAPTKSIFPDEPQTPETNLRFIFGLITAGYRFCDIHKNTVVRKQKAYGKCKQGEDFSIEFDAPEPLPRHIMFDMFRNDIPRLRQIINGNDGRFERVLIRRYEHWTKRLHKGEVEIVRAMDEHGLLG